MLSLLEAAVEAALLAAALAAVGVTAALAILQELTVGATSSNTAMSSATGAAGAVLTTGATKTHPAKVDAMLPPAKDVKSQTADVDDTSLKPSSS